LGIFCAGSIGTSSQVTAYVDKYAYASNTVSSGTALSAAWDGTTGGGNQTKGIFSGAYTLNGTGYITQKYTYAGDTVTYGGSLANFNNITYGTAASTSSFMLIGGAYENSKITNKYTFSTDVAVVATSIPSVYVLGGAIGNATIAVFGGGNYVSTATDIYTYASNVVTNGTALGLARHGVAACSNSQVGLFSGGTTNSGNGDPGISAYVDKYNLLNQTVTPGTSLLVVNVYAAATSSTPGGF
jgi:hypothetical protein